MTSAALVIGIDGYASNDAPNLNGCVADSQAVADLLRHNEPAEGTNAQPPPNLGQVVLCNDNKGKTTQEAIWKEIDKLAKADLDLTVLYFSGHGKRDDASNLGVLVTSDYSPNNPGIRMDDIVTRLTSKNHHPGKSIVIILDCCHSGSISRVDIAAGGLARTELPLGLTILASSRDSEESMIDDARNGSRFTNLLVDGLKGGCANVTGHVTPPALYAHIDNSLQALEQRPIFATNVQRSVVLRRCRPQVSSNVIRELLRVFPNADATYELDPTHESDRGEIYNEIIEPCGKSLREIPPDPEKVELFSKLQLLTRSGLVRPTPPEDHMYWAAVYSKTCELTEMGKHYWYLAKHNLLRD